MKFNCLNFFLLWMIPFSLSANEINGLSINSEEINLIEEENIISFKKNILIEKLEKIKTNEYQYIFHAGTRNQNQKYYSTGGRVLNFVSIDENFGEARKKSLELIKLLNWKYGHYRKDIGYKVINNK